MAEIAIAKRKCGDTYRETFGFIALLYFPLLYAISLRYLVEAPGLSSWFLIGHSSILAPFVKSVVFLFLYAPVLAIYESKFSLLRVLRQAS